MEGEKKSQPTKRYSKRMYIDLNKEQLRNKTRSTEIDSHKKNSAGGGGGGKKILISFYTHTHTHT